MPELAARGISLLPGHGDAEPFLRVDEVIMIILAEIELHPVEVSKTQRLNVATLSDYGDRGGSGDPLREHRLGNRPATVTVAQTCHSASLLRLTRTG